MSQSYALDVNQAKLDALAATGQVEVGVLVPKEWQSSSSFWFRRRDPDRGYPRLTLFPARVWFPNRVGAYLYPPLKMARVLAAFRPALLEADQEVFSLATCELAVAATLTRKPFVVLCAETVDRRVGLLRRVTRRVVFARARFIIAVSADAADRLRQWGYAGPIEILPRSVDAKLFAPRAKAEPGHDVVIGFMGRFQYQKGLDLLFEAAARLQEKGVHFRLVLCGTGNEEQALRADAERLGVMPLITWRDAVPTARVPEEMSAFDVLVLPSRETPTWRELFGMVLIEAMAMGIPVIGSSSGEIPRVIGCSDYVFPENDSAALAAVLERMITDDAWRAEAGNYGLRRVQERFSHERWAEQLIALWRKHGVLPCASTDAAREATETIDG